MPQNGGADKGGKRAPGEATERARVLRPSPGALRRGGRKGGVLLRGNADTGGQAGRTATFSSHVCWAEPARDRTTIPVSQTSTSAGDGRPHGLPTFPPASPERGKNRPRGGSAMRRSHTRARWEPLTTVGLVGARSTRLGYRAWCGLVRPAPSAHSEHSCCHRTVCEHAEGCAGTAHSRHVLSCHGQTESDSPLGPSPHDATSHGTGICSPVCTPCVGNSMPY